MGKHHQKDPYTPIYLGLVGFLVVAALIAYWMFG